MKSICQQNKCNFLNFFDELLYLCIMMIERLIDQLTKLRNTYGNIEVDISAEHAYRAVGENVCIRIDEFGDILAVIQDACNKKQRELNQVDQNDSWMQFKDPNMSEKEAKDRWRDAGMPSRMKPIELVETSPEQSSFNDRISKIIHVFDMVKDNIINAKIGKKVASLIAMSGQDAETVIKRIGLTNGMPDMRTGLHFLWTDHRDLLKKLTCNDYNAQTEAKRELLGIAMRKSGGKLNPGLVNQYLDNSVKDVVHGRLKYEEELAIWENETCFAADQGFGNEHFQNIVKMGEVCVPWIHETIDVHPHPIVHALDLIFPDVMKYEGNVSLADVCEAWSYLLQLTGDTHPNPTHQVQASRT